MVSDPGEQTERNKIYREVKYCNGKCSMTFEFRSLRSKFVRFRIGHTLT